jgi:hypothetical protein
VEVIGRGAFENCINLRKLTFEADSRLTEIRMDAFACTRKDDETVPATIERLTLPASLEIMEDGAFHCVPVVHFSLEEGSRLKEIPCGFLAADGSDAMPGIGTATKTLRDYIHDFIINFEEPYPFTPKQIAEACACLESVDLGDNNSLTKIGDGAFKNQLHLTSIRFGSDPQSDELAIGKGAFAAAGNNAYFIEEELDYVQCRGIEDLEFPSNLSELGVGAFRFARVENVIFSDYCPLEKIADGFLGIDGEDAMPGKINNPSVPRSILDAANCLKTVILGEDNKLGMIGYGAFRNQSHLVQIDLGYGENDLTIGCGAFMGAGNNASLIEEGVDEELNEGIEKLVFPANLTELQSGAFRLARVRNVTFDDGCRVENVGYSFMAIDGADGTPGNLEGYQAQLPQSVYNAANCLESVCFGAGNSLKTINNGAFKNQSHLAKVDLGSSENPLSIESGAFIGAGNNGYLVDQGYEDELSGGIDTFVFPGNLEHINDGAFNLARIKHLVFSDGFEMEQIPYGFMAVNGADGMPGNLDEFSYITPPPDLVTQGANFLESVEFGDGYSLGTIQDGSFKNQSHLKVIDLGTPAGDLRIEDGAFIGAGNNGYLVENGIDGELCEGIDTLVIPANVSYMASGVLRYASVRHLVFEDGSKLEEIGYSLLAVDGLDGQPGTTDGNGYSKIAPQCVINAANRLESVEFGEGYSITNINSGSFKNQSHLTYIDFGTPAGELTVSYGAFLGAGDNDYLLEQGYDDEECPGMDELVIPANMGDLRDGSFRYTRTGKISFEDGCNISNLDGGVFSNCDRLVEIDMRGSSIEKLDDTLKEDPELLSVIFSEDLRAITWGQRSDETKCPFYGSGSVEELHFTNSDPGNLRFDEGVFQFISETGTVYVPKGTGDNFISAYKDKLSAAGLQFSENGWKIEEEHDHVLSKTKATEPSCTEEGNSEYWTCSVCGSFFGDAEGKKKIKEGSWVIEATGHDWGDPEWKWSGVKSASATFICGNDETHTETLEAEITSSGGVYTATVSFENKTYTDKVTVLLGDVDLDGDVDSADLTKLARHVAKISVLTDPQALLNADVTMDGETGSNDLTKLARFVAHIIDTM